MLCEFAKVIPTIAKSGGSLEKAKHIKREQPSTLCLK